MSVADLTFDPHDEPGGAAMVFFANGKGAIVTRWAADAYTVEPVEGTAEAWSGVGYSYASLSAASADEALAVIEG